MGVEAQDVRAVWIIGKVMEYKDNSLNGANLIQMHRYQ